jgi:hypothetical protein
MCGFLAALDLSAVRLYGDDRPITSSASNSGSPREKLLMFAFREVGFEISSLICALQIFFCVLGV